jgi:hypothetical protein
MSESTETETERVADDDEIREPHGSSTKKRA